jgi:hypothetical protein
MAERIDKEFEAIVGLQEREAKKALQNMGIKVVRTVERNEHYFTCTCDYSLDRVNIHIQDDAVYQIYRG